jgi:soluble lytic murein transglycosylase-like protein
MLKLMLSLLLAGCAATVADVRADIYKYMDSKGNTYFTDAPLRGGKYRLEWKRESRSLAGQNRERLRSLIDRNQSDRTQVAPVAPVAVGGSSEAGRSLAARRARYERVIAAYAVRYGLTPELLHAVIRAESAYTHSAVSRAGAQGLMQLMPGTAARYGVKDSFNPVENVRAGAAYLRDLLDMFGQDLRLALAGYNAGENAVIRYGNRIPPYSETEGYVRKVLEYLWSERSTGRMVSAR